MPHNYEDHRKANDSAFSVSCVFVFFVVAAIVAAFFDETRTISIVFGCIVLFVVIITVIGCAFGSGHSVPREYGKDNGDHNDEIY